MAYSTMYFSLLLIFLLFITEVNPKTSLREPKLERVVPGTNKWPLTKFFASLCCHMNTTIQVGVEIQRSDGGWKHIGGATKNSNKSRWKTNLDGRKYEITSNGYFVINVTRVDNGAVYKLNVLGLDTGNEPVLIKLVYSPLELNEPIITEQSPTPVIVTENGTTTLFCKSSGNPPPTTTWTKDGNDSVLHEGVNLTLVNITQEQGGNYTCTVQNGIGRKANASIPVTVHYPPTIEIGPSDQTALEGSNIFLQCTATGNPKPTIKWSKGDNQTVLQEGEIFLLPKTQIQETGVYKCTAQNGIGKPLSNTATLNVKSYDTSTTADTGSMANRISKGFAIAFGVLILFALVFLLYKRLGCSCSQKKFIVPKDDDCDLDQEHLEMQNYGAGVDVQGQERIAAAL